MTPKEACGPASINFGQQEQAPFPIMVCFDNAAVPP
jgi:hypothetical protein